MLSEMLENDETVDLGAEIDEMQVGPQRMGDLPCPNVPILGLVR